MRTIWKWSLNVLDLQALQMPRGAQILSVQMQGEVPQVWALCDPDQPKEPRKIAIHGTGHNVPKESGRYISTFQLLDGNLVFHAFDVAHAQD